MREKDLLRQQLLTQREVLTMEVLAERSQRIIQRVESHFAYVQARHIMAFIGVRSEVQTMSLLRHIVSQKKLFLPKQHNNGFTACFTPALDDLVTGPFGIPEPMICDEQSNNFDCILIPGVGFTKEGKRLGYGKGMYDRFLKDTRGIRIALCFEFQVVEHIPTDQHDQNVDLIITEDRVIDCRNL